jgi:hypothetical protein
MEGLDRDSALAQQVERTLTEIHGLEAALDSAELTVAGSTGQPRGNPLLAELRAHRRSLLALLGVFSPEGAGPVEDELDRLRQEWESGAG